MSYKYVSYRNYTLHVEHHETLEEALSSAWADLEWNNAWPFELWEGDTLLWSNEGGHPLRDGTCPLTDKINAYAIEQGWDD